MIIKTPRSLAHLVIDSLLTTLAWLAFFYLLAKGVLSIARKNQHGAGLPTMTHLLPSMGTLLSYVMVAIFIAIALYVWAQYNARRFGSLDRRSMPPPLMHEDLAASFGVSVEQLEQLRRSCISVVHHTHDGHIVGIETSGA